MRIELELEKEADKEAIKAVVERYLKGTEFSARGDKVKIKAKLLNLHVAGIKGIDDVIVIKEGEDWIIQTAGSNLKKILKMPEVDLTKTKTNDIHQVYDVLGIEAARNVILLESKETLDEQGLEVDIRHLTLLADTMSFDGEVKAIGRYGISGKKGSVLAKANFEETKKHLVNASFYGETDNLYGVIENILVGQVSPIGTGMVELGVDLKKLQESVKKK